MNSAPQPPDDDKRHKRVEVLYRGFGVPAPLTRSPFMFRRIVQMRSVFSFGFEEKDVVSNPMLARLWRWSLPTAVMSLAILMQLGLFAGAGVLKYLVFTTSINTIGECFLFMVARGAAWGLLMGLLTLWCLPWAVGQWRGRQVLMDIKLTPLRPREIFAAIWLPPLHIMMLPMLALSLLDFLIVPLGVLYLEGERFSHPQYEAATLLGLLFQYSIVYMAMMLVFTASIRSALREKSAGLSLWFTLGWTIHYTAIAALKFFFNLFFIVFVFFVCFGQPGPALLLYGAWFGYHICDGLKETIAEQMREAEKHWWEWMAGEK